MVTEARSVAVRILAPEAELRRQLLDEARISLLNRPRELSPKWFYDERGCSLFDEITRLPEYYLTGREREILMRRSSEIAELTKATLLIEPCSRRTTTRTGLRRPSIATSCSCSTASSSPTSSRRRSSTSCAGTDSTSGSRCTCARGDGSA